MDEALSKIVKYYKDFKMCFYARERQYQCYSMYYRSLFTRLNNYGCSDNSIKELKNFFNDLKQPDRMDTNAKARRYYEKCIQFEVRYNKLFYKKHNFEVVSNDQRNEKMKEMYEVQRDHHYVGWGGGDW